MNKIRYLCLIFLVLIFNSISTILYSENKTEILYKINEEIITNIDLENEEKFLIFLNPNLSNLSKDQLLKISKNSLMNRKIKEVELNKIYDFDKNKSGEKYLQRFIKNSKYNNAQELANSLKEFNLEYEYLVKNFHIDNVWREFIYEKFKSQVKINVESLKKQIQNQKTNYEELNLSEILFKPDADNSFDKLTKKIYEEIDSLGFEATASVYSISETKKFGGKLGWIKSNQISKEIYAEIKKGDLITKPIKTNSGYLILKLNKKRTVEKKVNLEEELQKLINIETDKELNKFGYIYFNKIKKRTFISEI